MVIKESSSKTVIVYKDSKGREPFTKWLHSIKDRTFNKRITARLLRLEEGLYGDCKPVGAGVSELRLFFGAGYRIYFGEENDTIILLLCAGDKATQQRDIELAKTYWQEYKKDD